MFKLVRKAGAARLFIAGLAVALAAALIALTLHLQAGGADAGESAPRAGSGAPPSVPAAADSAAEADALERRLREHLAQQPRDARAWTILARLEFERDRFAEAAQAYEKALALRSKVANDPAVWCEYADALGMTQGGTLAGKPRELVDRALALDPNHPKALEMAGSSEYERGDYAAALRFWRPLLAVQQPGSQAYAELAAAVARAERLAATSIDGRRR